MLPVAMLMSSHVVWRAFAYLFPSRSPLPLPFAFAFPFPLFCVGWRRQTTQSHPFRSMSLNGICFVLYSVRLAVFGSRPLQAPICEALVVSRPSHPRSMKRVRVAFCLPPQSVCLCVGFRGFVGNFRWFGSLAKRADYFRLRKSQN